jgi:hypothetical protein
VLAVVQRYPGFRDLVLSDPSPLKRNQRLAWIVFEPGSDLTVPLAELDGKRPLEEDEYELHVAVAGSHVHRVRAAAECAGSETRLRHDLGQVRQLVRLMDRLYGLDNPILDPVEGYSAGEQEKDSNEAATSGTLPAAVEDEEEGPADSDGRHAIAALKRSGPPSPTGLSARLDPMTADLGAVKRQLDVLILYLRVVHRICYYCRWRADSVEELTKECGALHIRKLPASNAPATSTLKYAVTPIDGDDF